MENTKKPIYKKWWFWIIIIFVLFRLLSYVHKSFSNTQPVNNTSISNSNTSISDSNTIQTTSNNTTQVIPQSEKKPLEVKQLEYYVNQNGYLYYSIMLHNPNSDYGISLPSYRITAKRADGVILGSEDKTLFTIYPNQDYLYTDQAFSVSDSPSEVVVDLLPLDDYKFKKLSRLKYNDFVYPTVENASKIDGGTFPKITGEINNRNPYDISCVMVSVIFRDEQGNFIGGNHTFVNNVLANNSTAFELTLIGGKHSNNFEVYVCNWDS